MGSSTNKDLSYYARRESIKIEVLDIFIELYEQSKLALDKEAKEFIVNRAGELMDTYDINSSIPSRKFLIEGEDGSEMYVKLSAVDNLFEEMRVKLSKAILHMLSYELVAHLTGEENNEED